MYKINGFDLLKYQVAVQTTIYSTDAEMNVYTTHSINWKLGNHAPKAVREVVLNEVLNL